MAPRGQYPAHLVRRPEPARMTVSTPPLSKHLQARGPAFYYQGDFGGGGLRIAATPMRHVTWRPWRNTGRASRRRRFSVCCSQASGKEQMRPVVTVTQKR
ncbi:DUF2399 domain-containing protein [Streptomyces virginiae]|uniref:DUF2399 domain-containing protein n=1 Tax=Streptomyces virginiae TaxID=1961 RepID=UPI00363B994C